MATCGICGKSTGASSSVHPECQQEAERRTAAGDAGRSPEKVMTSTPDATAGLIMCNVLGVLFLLVGLYFLVVEPGNPVADTLPDSVAGIRVVNFQRLAIGQAFTVAGAIFLAAAWRPRR